MTLNQAASESHTASETVAQQIQIVPLLRPDEVALQFARETGAQLLLIKGRKPVWCLRVDYHASPWFHGRDVGSKPSPKEDVILNAAARRDQGGLPLLLQRLENGGETMARRGVQEARPAEGEEGIDAVGDIDKLALLVKRFDREKVMSGYRRARMVSGLTLLGAEDTHQSRDKWSHVALAEELRRISATPKKDAEELFRRMCFNALISNTDDHPRNHAVIAPGVDWKLSPVYDLTPQNLISLERRDLAMACGDRGRQELAPEYRTTC